jgi:quinol monooxygenase YgiN
MRTLLGIARFTFTDKDKASEFRRLSEECMRIVREQDPGTLRYEIFLDETGLRAMVIEEYEDVAALIAHSQNIGDELSRAVISTGEVVGELLGEIPQDFRDGLAGGPVTSYLRILAK